MCCGVLRSGVCCLCFLGGRERLGEIPFRTEELGGAAVAVVVVVVAVFAGGDDDGKAGEALGRGLLARRKSGDGSSCCLRSVTGGKPDMKTYMDRGKMMMGYMTFAISGISDER